MDQNFSLKAIINIITFVCMANFSLQQASNYREIHTEEGIEYLSSHGLSINDVNPNYQIPSGCGYVYSLDNGEIVLLESGLRDGFPAFVFSNIAAFKECITGDYFPVSAQYTTWLEANASNVRNFMANEEFFSMPLQSIGIQTSFNTVSDCQLAYRKVYNYVHDKKNKKQDRQNIITCYALAMAKYFINVKKYRWHMEKRYRVYNPYYCPLIEISKGDYLLKKDIISKAFRGLESNDAESFRMFYFYCTGIAPVDHID